MTEKKVLYVSVVFAVLFALFGIVGGIIIKSTMIMFDGIYSTISVLLSLLSVVVLSQVSKGKENDKFPFGKWHFEPALLILKSFVIVSLCIYSLSNAVGDLFAGGNHAKIGLAFIYASGSFIICTGVYLYIKIKNKDIKSDLLSAESTQWLGDSFLTFGVMIGFGVTFLLRNTGFSTFTPYMDPLMVVIASLFFLYFPIKSLTQGVREIIFFRVDEAIAQKVREHLDTISVRLDAEYKMHLVKIGRELFLEVNFLTKNMRLSVEEMDKIRYEIEEGIDGNIWLNMNITSNPKWV